MRKIPNLFIRGKDGKITAETNPECQWVFEGEGTPTEKLDGANLLLTVTDGKITSASKRHGGLIWHQCQPSLESRGDRWMINAVANTYAKDWPDGQHYVEAVGPGIQANPLQMMNNLCWPFMLNPIIVSCYARNFKEIGDFLWDMKSRISPWCNAEGIVWHHPDGRMAKAKRKDFRQLV